MTPDEIRQAARQLPDEPFPTSIRRAIRQIRDGAPVDLGPLTAAVDAAVANVEQMLAMDLAAGRRRELTRQLVALDCYQRAVRLLAAGDVNGAEEARDRGLRTVLIPDDATVGGP